MSRFVSLRTFPSLSLSFYATTMVDRTILSVPHNHAHLAPLHHHISRGTDTASADIRIHKPIDTDSTVARAHNSLRMNSQINLANLSTLLKENALDSAPFKLSFANLVDDSGNFTYIGMAPDSVLHTLVTEFVRCTHSISYPRYHTDTFKA